MKISKIQNFLHYLERRYPPDAKLGLQSSPQGSGSLCPGHAATWRPLDGPQTELSWNTWKTCLSNFYYKLAWKVRRFQSPSTLGETPGNRACANEKLACATFTIKRPRKCEDCSPHAPSEDLPQNCMCNFYYKLASKVRRLASLHPHGGAPVPPPRSLRLPEEPQTM